MIKGHDEVLRVFDHLIPHTENIRDHLRGQGIPLERMSLLPHPAVRLPRGAGCRRPLRRARARATLCEILLFGSLKPYKGADVLVRAGLAPGQAPPRLPHHHLPARPFYDLEPLRAEIAAAGAADLIQHRGPATRASQELGHAGSKEPTSSSSPIARSTRRGAFACASQFGKPIVATDLGVFAEAPVRDHLRLLPPESPEALASVLEELIADPEKRAHWAERSRALQGLMYTWDRFARDCVDIYARLGRAREQLPHAA